MTYQVAETRAKGLPRKQVLALYELAAQKRSHALGMLAVELGSGYATQRSIGVLYALLIATLDMEPDTWRPINDAIMAALDLTDLKSFDRLKRVGWNIHDGMVEVEKEARAARDARSSGAPPEQRTEET